MEESDVEEAMQALIAHYKEPLIKTALNSKNSLGDTNG